MEPPKESIKAMEFKVKRYHDNGDATLGCFTYEDKVLYSLEDEHRIVKLKGETRIPAGKYEIKLRDEGGMNKRYQDKFKGFHRGMLWLQDVPDFEWVYIHIGNREDQTLGCILVGMLPAKGMKVQRSTEAHQVIYEDALKAFDRGEKVFITIEDE